MTNSNAKGERCERELVTTLADAGWGVLRAPASGAATDRDLPDVLAGNGDRFLAIEAKASGADAIYIDRSEIEALEYFAGKFGATPVVGVRFDREDWYFRDPAACHVTDGGNYRIKRETALASGQHIETVVGES